MPAIEITPAPRPAKSYGVSLTPGACSAVQSFTAAAIAGDLEPTRTLTFKRIWDCLPVAERREACVSVFASSADPHTVRHRKALTETLVRFFRFRPSFFARKTDWEKASHLIDVMNDHTFPANDLPLRSWLLTHHNAMIREFLDELGLSHRAGIISYDPAPPTAPGVDALRRAVLTIVRKYPPLPVGVYLAFISYQPMADDVFMNLGEALREEQIDLEVLLGMKEAPLPEAVEARSPDSEFTTLDRLLLSTIDAAACGVQGALNHDQLEDLVEETIELSAARPRSLYHRGLMHALLGRPLEFQFPGADEPRRLWYFTGALAGLLRSGDAGPALDLMAGQHALAARLMSVQGAACGTLLLPGLHAALVRAGKAALACGWARAQVQSFPLHERPAIIASFQDLGEEQLARGGLAEATLLLEFVRDNVSARGARPPEFARSLRSRNARTLAQVLQARGRFDQATAMLRELVSSRDDAAAAGALADLGLVHAGFRSVTAALPRSQEEANIPLAKSLEKGRASFEESVERCPGASAVAHVCLGISAFVAQPPRPAAAADHLREALQVLVRDGAEGQEGGAGDVVRWTRFCLAISLLETLDSSALQRAGDLLEHALESPAAYPDYLWSRTLQAAALFDDQSLAERICERLIERNDSRAFALLGSTGLYRRSARLRAMYQGWLGRAPVAAHKRWQQTRALLAAAVEHTDLPVAEQALDALEGLAMELPGQRRELIAMLEEPENYPPAWSPDDADAARTRLLELDGEYAAAAQALLRRFHKARAAGGEHHLAYARDLLEVIDGYRLKDLDTAPFHRLVADARPLALSGDPLDPLRRGARARILYIGGNEKQRASETALLAAFQAEYPGLEVTFMFPGFSSNWRPYVDEVERMLPGVDAVCLSFLVRTTFGRHVRALCSSATPWFPCTGGGKQCMRRSIERAALWAVTRPTAAAA